MNKSIYLWAIVLVIANLTNQSQSYPMNVLDNRDSFGHESIVKRSLCNVYGGCGNKRSLHDFDGESQQQQQQTLPETNQAIIRRPMSGTDQSDWTRSGLLSRSKEHRAKLMAETLVDLMDHLQSNERYRRGKYVVIVPGQDSLLSAGSMGSHSSSSSNSALNLQELVV